ncbi:MAG: HAMP domain-containing protein [Candidatus Marinimicrobia bacterium]|jgi:PAS domain S-box-containing protein|nr:HAMP domain-containing protein [Candidatus Neomarinimicrobiota bacterium]MDD5541210.1 HAMP domain-containing protein [Candidatus Neomarinimicrobiota bacterium]
MNQNDKKENFLLKLSIKNKLILTQTIIIGLIAVFFFFYYPFQMKARSISALMDKSTTMAHLIALHYSHLLNDKDKSSAGEIIEAVRQHENLHYIVVQDQSGHIFTGFNLPGAIAADYQSVPDKPNFGFKQLYFKTTIPISYNQETVGKLFLGFSLTNLYREIYLFRYDVTILSLSILLIGFFTVIGISNLITRPLKEIVTTAEKITAGSHEERVPIQGADEISTLAQAFNTMMDKLESAHEEVDKVNKELEIIVESRTAALSITNAQLQAELRARRQAEKDLSAEKELITTTLSAIDDGVISTDINGKIVLMNKAAEMLTGWLELHAANEPLSKVLRIAENPAIDQALHQIMTNRQPSVSLEKGTLIDNNGKSKKIIYTISAIRDNFGEIIGSVIIFRYI